MRTTIHWNLSRALVASYNYTYLRSIGRANHLHAREGCREEDWWNNGNKAPEYMSFTLHHCHGPPVNANVVHVPFTPPPFIFSFIFLFLLLSSLSLHHSTLSTFPRPLCFAPPRTLTTTVRSGRLPYCDQLSK